jgi:hypothetical protein
MQKARRQGGYPKPARGHGLIRPLTTALAASVAVLLASAPALGQSVRVRSRTVVWAQISPDSERLEGYLADDLGHRLAGKSVVVVWSGGRLTVRTDERGEFGLALSGVTGVQQLTLAFEGDEFLEAVSNVIGFDPVRRAVRLQLMLPSTVPLDRELVEVQVRAEQGDQPLQLPITITLQPTGEVIGQGETDPSGWAHVSIETNAFRVPGRHTLEARTEGDETFAPALTQASLIAEDVTVLTLVTNRRRLLTDEHLQLRGRLTGARGALPREVIRLQTGDQTLDETITDGEGAFEISLPARSLAVDQQSEVRARYESPLPWRRSCESPAQRIFVEQPQPMNWGQVVVPVLVTALLLALVLWVTTRRREAEPRRTKIPEAHIESGLLSGVTFPRTGRREERFDLSGQVWDPVRPGPVDRADLSVACDQGPRIEQTKSDGRFAFDDLPQGRHVVDVSSAGYVPESFQAAIPHQGQLHDVRVHLVQVRHRALELYRDVAHRLLPKPKLWGRWTPRELAIHTAKQHPRKANELVDLTSVFEEVYYSPRQNTLDDLERIRLLVGRLEGSDESPTSSGDDG